MDRKVTIKDAARRWVSEYMDQIDTNMIEELMQNDEFDWEEVTRPTPGDKVRVYGQVETFGGWEGEATRYDEDEEKYEVEFENGKTAMVAGEDLYLSDSGLPAWGTMFKFRDSADKDWLDCYDGIRIMSKCGFKIFESQRYGYFFGIDAGGYDFYEAFWIPLYKARGLKWHNVDGEREAA